MSTILGEAQSILINHELVGLNNTGVLPESGFPVRIKLSGNWLKTIDNDPDNGRIKNEIGIGEGKFIVSLGPESIIE